MTTKIKEKCCHFAATHIRIMKIGPPCSLSRGTTSHAVLRMPQGRPTNLNTSLRLLHDGNGEVSRRPLAPYNPLTCCNLSHRVADATLELRWRLTSSCRTPLVVTVRLRFVILQAHKIDFALSVIFWNIIGLSPCNSGSFTVRSLHGFRVTLRLVPVRIDRLSLAVLEAVASCTQGTRMSRCLIFPHDVVLQPLCAT